MRLGCCYTQELTLAETGRILGEHEATVSSKLARTRTRIREHVELSAQALGQHRLERLVRPPLLGHDSSYT